MKLPGISTTWNVRELKSPKAAGLGNKLRAIDATAQGITAVASAAGRAIDDRANADSKLAAARISNTIESEMVAGEVELQQDYMNREDFDPDLYKQDRESMRERIIRQNSNNLSSRQKRYLEPALSKHRGAEFERRTQQTILDFTKERAHYQLELLSDSNMQAVDTNPDATDALLETYSTTLDDTGIGSITSRKATVRAHARELRVAQVNALIRDNRVADGYDVVENDPSDLFTGKDKQDLLAALATASEFNIDKLISEESFLLANNPELYHGQDRLNAVLGNLPQDNIVMANETIRYEKGRFDAYVTGLIAQQEFDTAEAELVNQNNADLMDGPTMLAHRKAITSNRANALSGELTTILSDTNDYTNKLLNSGEQNPAAMAQLRILQARVTSASDKTRVNAAIQYVELTEEFAGEYVTGLDDMSLDEMQALQNGALTWSEMAEDNIDRGRIYTAWESQLNTRRAAMLTDGAGYLSDNDPTMRGLEDKASNSMMAVVQPLEGADPVATMRTAQQDIAAYISAVKNGLTERGVPALSQTYIPADSALANLLTGNLDSIQPRDQFNALVRLSAVIPDTDMSNAVLRQLADNNPAYGAALAHTRDGNQALANLTLEGYAKVQAASDNETETQFDMGYLDSRISSLTGGVLDGSNEFDKVRKSIAYAVVGSLGPEEVGRAYRKGSSGSAPQLDDSKFLAIIDMTIGQSFVPNSGASPTVSYTREQSNTLVTADQWKAQANYAAGHIVETHGTEMYSAFGEVLDAEDVMDKARFIPVGNGLYEVRLPHSTLISTQAGEGAFTSEGTVLRDDGTPFILDMHSVPMPTQLEKTMRIRGAYRMKVSGERFLEDQLKIDEGFRAASYVDTEGHLTAGTGHKLTREEQRRYPEGTEIPTDVTDKWFKQDVSKARAGAGKLIREMGLGSVPTEFRHAIENMVFQMGVTGVRGFKQMWIEAKAGNIAGIIREMKDSKWFKSQTPERAARVISSVETGSGFA